MKYKPDKNQLTWAITVFLTAAAVLIFFYLLFNGSRFTGWMGEIISHMMGIVYGIIIAYILSPVLNFIEDHILIPIYRRFGIDMMRSDESKKRQMRKISVAITFLFMVAVLYGVIRIIVPQLIRSIETIIRNFPIYINNVEKFFNHLLESNPEQQSTFVGVYSQLEEQLNNFVKKNFSGDRLSSLLQVVYRSVYKIISSFFDLIIGMIVSVYLLNSKEDIAGRFKKMAYAFFDESWANEIVGAFRFTHHTFIGFITGKIVDSVIIGILCFIGTKIIGTPFPVLVSFIVGITNLIPFFGPYIGAIISSILDFMINPLDALYILLFVIALQQFDGNILGPKILGDSTGLSSFWVIFAILMFGAMWGVTGWVVGVPLFAVFYALTGRITNHYLRRKGKTTSLSEFRDTAYYEEGVRLSIRDENATSFHTQKPRTAWARALHMKERPVREMAKEKQEDKCDL